MAETDNTSQQIARLLAWYADMGATGVTTDVPLDWRGRTAAPGAGFKLPTNTLTEAVRADPAPTSAVPVPAAPPRGAGAAGSEASRKLSHSQPAPLSPPSGAPLRTFDRPAARTPARPAPVGGSSRTVEARSLDELRQALEAFDGCGLKATAKNLCLYRGAERARVMVIGEAPGRDEDIAGKPFVGAAGQLLDRMLASVGLGEADVHIANVVYWRPPGNRTPTPAEALACQPFLDRQIALVQPEVLFLLGGVAAKHMLSTEEGIMKLRGRWRDIERGGQRVRALPSLHPAYLLRSPAAKRQAWRDLLMLRAALDEKAG